MRRAKMLRFVAMQKNGAKLTEKNSLLPWATVLQSRPAAALHKDSFNHHKSQQLIRRNTSCVFRGPWAHFIVSETKGVQRRQ